MNYKISDFQNGYRSRFNIYYFLSYFSFCFVYFKKNAIFVAVIHTY